MRTLHSLHTIDVHPDELGVTVRLGDKWADAKDQDIELCVCLPTPDDHTVVGTAKVLEVWNGAFRNMPIWMLKNEHEFEARTYDGLFRSMKRAYGDKFHDVSSVTALIYKRTS